MSPAVLMHSGSSRFDALETKVRNLANSQNQCECSICVGGNTKSRNMLEDFVTEMCKLEIYTACNNYLHNVGTVRKIDDNIQVTYA